MKSIITFAKYTIPTYCKINYQKDCDKKLDLYKLNYILYYVYVENLLLNDTKLFKEKFNAGIFGPYCKKLESYFKDCFFQEQFLSFMKYDKSNNVSLSDEEKILIDDNIKWMIHESTDKIHKRFKSDIVYLLNRRCVTNNYSNDSKYTISDIEMKKGYYLHGGTMNLFW